MLLLNHSDCDGIIRSKNCRPLADDLESILGKLDDQPEWSDYGGAPPPARVGGGLINQWTLEHARPLVANVAITKQFIAGLRAAAAAGDDVEFG